MRKSLLLSTALVAVFAAAQANAFEVKDGETIKISQYEVSEVVMARIEEILVLARKEINTLGSGKSDDSYINSVPEKVEQMARVILPEYGYSLPSIEYWFLLHFADIHRLFPTSQSVCKELEKFLDGYDKREE